MLINNESFGILSKLVRLIMPNFFYQTNDILKVVFKQENYLSNESKSKINISKIIDGIIFYLINNTVT